MTETINHSERAHALLSASSAHRWLNCPPSAIAAEKYPDQDTEFTREGTLAHEVAEAVTRGENNAAWQALMNNPNVTGEMIDCANSYRDYIQEQVKSPTAIVLLEQRVNYSPWAPEGFGTCDCLILQDETLTIIDYKYGVGVPVSAIGNPQMKLYALGALNDFGLAYDVKKVETHIFQPRLDNISADALSVDELLAWGEECKPAAKQAYRGKGKYNAGEHCRFCPHAGRCRKLAQVCTEYVETHSLRVAVPVLAPHEVAEVLRMKPLIDLWLRRVKAQALDTLLEGGEVPGFKVVEGKQGERKWSDELKVAEAFEKAGYSREDITVTTLKSPAQMDKALGKKAVAELTGGLVDRAPGKPTIVPDTDDRPAYDRRAELLKDFE